MASMSPPTEAVRQARRRRGRSALPAALTLQVEVLEQLVCRMLDLLVPRLRGSVRAGDQPHPVDPTEVAVDEGVARLRAVLRAHGQAEVPFGVVLPRVRLEVGVLVAARGWRSMATRSATSASSRRPPDRRADAQPFPQPIQRPCATQPAGGDDLDLTAPGGGGGLLRGQLPGDRRHQPGQRRAVDLVGPPEVVDHLGDRVS